MAFVCRALWRRMGRLAFQTSKAFWLKQGSAGLSVGSLLFLGSVAFGKLMMKFFATQVFQPDTPDKESSLKLLYAYPDVKRGLIIATLIIGFENVILAALNFMLNLNIVTPRLAPSSSTARWPR